MENLMSRDQHPAFRYKDASNQPTLFDMMSEADDLIAATRQEIERVETDLRFLLILLHEYGGQ